MEGTSESNFGSPIVRVEERLRCFGRRDATVLVTSKWFLNSGATHYVLFTLFELVGAGRNLEARRNITTAL